MTLAVTVRLSVEGVTTASERLLLGDGESTDVTFTHRFDGLGERSIEIDATATPVRSP